MTVDRPTKKNLPARLSAFDLCLHVSQFFSIVVQSHAVYVQMQEEKTKVQQVVRIKIK